MNRLQLVVFVPAALATSASAQQPEFDPYTAPWHSPWARYFHEFAHTGPAETLKGIQEIFDQSWMDPKSTVDLEKCIRAINTIEPSVLVPYLEKAIECSEASPPRPIRHDCLKLLVKYIDPAIVVGEFGDRLLAIRDGAESRTWREEAAIAFQETVLEDLQDLPAALKHGLALSPRTVQLPFRNPYFVAYEPNGREVTVRTSHSYDQNELVEHWIDRIDTDSLKSIAHHRIPGQFVSIREDGAKVLFYSFENSDLEMFDSRTGKVSGRFKHRLSPVDAEQVFWMADGSALAVYLDEKMALRLRDSPWEIEEHPLPQAIWRHKRRSFTFEIRAFFATDKKAIYCVRSLLDTPDKGPVFFEQFSPPNLDLAQSQLLKSIYAEYYVCRQLGNLNLFCGTRLPYGGQESGVEVFDPARDALIWKRRFFSFQYPELIDISNDGRWIALRGGVGRIKYLWREPKIPAHCNILVIVDSRNGRPVVAFDPESMTKTRLFEGEKIKIGDDFAISGSFRPDARELVIGYSNGMVRFWNLPDLNLIADQKPESVPVSDWDTTFPWETNGFYYYP